VTSLESSTIATLYALLATLAVMMLAAAMPPFQNADELAHLYRANQISHLHVLGENLNSGASGGRVDLGLYLASKPFEKIPFHLENKVTAAMYTPVEWGPAVEVGFPNTDIYPPLFYLPAATALFVCRTAGVAPLHAVYAARIAGGLTSIGIASMAIALAGDGALWLFAILLLPMSLALTAAVSQDAPMLAVTALAVALCRRAGASPRLLAAAAFFLALVAMCRPPYAAAALLLLGTGAPWRQRWMAATCVAGTALAWGLLNLHLARLPPYPEGVTDPVAQLHHLFAAPGQIPSLLAATWHLTGKMVLASFIGGLGWLDVDLPAVYLTAAWVMLAVALGIGGRAARLRTALLPAAACFGAAAGVALLQYLTWSVVGAPAIDGMQGRYFLAPALLLAALPTPPARGWITALQAGLLTFPILSIPVTLYAILQRYYV
jgi:hypothetical protein